jgi:antitoxin MazE
MQVRLSKWGNSLGLRLPRALAQQVGLRAGQKVNIVVEGERLIVEPVFPRLFLQKLLVNMTPEAMRAAYDWGDDAARERVND